MEIDSTNIIIFSTKKYSKSSQFRLENDLFILDNL